MRDFMVGIALALTASPACSDASLDAGGKFDAVIIGGFVLPVKDVEALLAMHVLSFSAEVNRFVFGDRIQSEQDLAKLIKELSLERPLAPRDLYRSIRIKLPNGIAHELTVPSGYGPWHFSNQSSGPILAASFGGVSRVPYTSEPDGALGLGLSFGNSMNGIGVSISMSFNDLSEISNLERVSWGFNVSNYLSDGVSISTGGENVAAAFTDGQESFYIAGSWAFSPESNRMPFNGTITIGAGNGRFSEKTPRDVFEGRGEHGTTVFGSISWEAAERVNLVSEWNGRNLNIGVAWRPEGIPVSMKIGVENLTEFSGNGPIVTGSMGVLLARF